MSICASEYSPKILLDNGIRIGVLKGKHPAPGVLNQDDLIGAKELLRNDDGAECILSGRSGLLQETNRTYKSAFLISCLRWLRICLDSRFHHLTHAMVTILATPGTLHGHLPNFIFLLRACE